MSFDRIGKKEIFVTVPADADGQRLDRWLKKSMPFILAQKLIRKGAIRIDGKRTKQDARITEGQEIRIPAFENATQKKAPKPLTTQEQDRIASWVLYDDGDIVVINKPYGVSSQGGENVTDHVDRLLPALAGQKNLTPKLVHRLDKETSGVMVLARVPATIRHLGKMFKSREVKKIYWAIVSPVPELKEGAIRAPIGQGSAFDKMCIDEDEGKFALTDFVTMDKAGDQFAFVAFWPRTGRTHQIRVHATEALSCPIVGDRRYGGVLEEDHMGLAKRLHLHAGRILLPLKGNKILDVSAPLPDELMESWKALGFDYALSRHPFEDKK